MYTKVKGDNRRAVGKIGERFARQFLERSLGWDIVTQNWRCRIGEIDLIAMDDDTLVIVEVRTRQTMNFGSALDSVVYKKGRQLRRLTAYYLNTTELDRVVDYRGLRVDVIGLQMSGGVIVELVHLKNAIDGFE